VDWLQKTPWVRLTDSQGIVTVFAEESFTNDLGNYHIRTMDCMDCHNRPAHRYTPPDDAVNLALSLGQISQRNAKRVTFSSLAAQHY
jgi:hypothetical protein